VKGRSRARWIDLGRVEPIGFHAAYAGLAEAQGPEAVPIVVWGRASAHLCLGQSQGRCEVADGLEVPVVRRPLGGGTVWVDEQQVSYALIAPLEDAPRRHEEWYAWALAPAIATFAAFELPVERRAEDLWLGGRKIAGSGAATIGRCAVVASSFLLRFPRDRFAACVAAPSPGFRRALYAALELAMTDWAHHAAPPPEPMLRRAFHAALPEALGWAARPSGMRGEELAAIAAWHDELAEPIEHGRPRVAGGIKLNAALYLRQCSAVAPVELAPLARVSGRGVGG
jgi:lipoate-protein ligase A